MSVDVKVKKVRVGQLVLSPNLSPEYRRTILGLNFRVSSFSQVPERRLMDFLTAHPPIGRFEGGVFQVSGNFRSLAIKPFLPAETQITVIEETRGGGSHIEFDSAHRELLSLVVYGMRGPEYARSIAAVWDLIRRSSDGKQSFIPSKKLLAQFSGLRRQSLSERPKNELETPATKRAGQ